MGTCALGLILSFTMLSSAWPASIQQWKPEIIYWSLARHLPPDLVAGVITIESAGNANHIGPIGEVGLMQVVPNTVPGFQWRTEASPERLLDLNYNLRWGTSILAIALKQAGGGRLNYRNALGAYNCGWKGLHAGRCGKYGGYAYADKVLDRVRANCVTVQPTRQDTSHDMEAE